MLVLRREMGDLRCWEFNVETHLDILMTAA
jgi:hypothetical protein